MSYDNLPPERPGPHDAGKAFLQGFSGCLGVGLAILAVLFVLFLVLAIASHH